MFQKYGNATTFGSVVLFLFLCWVVYLLLKVAQHVHAWPFS